jgi:hypothetical protein
LLMLRESIPIAALGRRYKLPTVILTKQVKASKKLCFRSTVDPLHPFHGFTHGIHDDVIFAVIKHQGPVSHSINAHEGKPSTIVLEREILLAMGKRNVEVAPMLTGRRHPRRPQGVSNRNACDRIHELRRNRRRFAASLKRQSNDEEEDKARQHNDKNYTDWT